MQVVLTLRHVKPNIAAIFHACVFELVPFSLAVVDSCCVLAWSRVNGTRACLNGYSMWMHDLVFIAGASLDVA